MQQYLLAWCAMVVATLPIDVIVGDIEDVFIMHRTFMLYIEECMFCECAFNNVHLLFPIFVSCDVTDIRLNYTYIGRCLQP